MRLTGGEIGWPEALLLPAAEDMAARHGASLDVPEVFARPRVEDFPERAPAPSAASAAAEKRADFRPAADPALVAVFMEGGAVMLAEATEAEAMEAGTNG